MKAKGRQHVAELGFIINRQIGNHVIEVQVHSHRIPMLKPDIGRKAPLLIIEIYVPHNDYVIEEIEKFDSQVETHLDQPAYQKIVIGHFNDQLPPKSAYHKYLGKFTSAIWE